MKVQAIINGIEIELYLKKGDDKTNYLTIKDAVEKTEKTWKESKIFIANYPEKGRSINKHPGFIAIYSKG